MGGGKSEGRNKFVERFPAVRTDCAAQLTWLRAAANDGSLLVVDDALVFERAWQPALDATGATLVERTRARITQALTASAYTGAEVTYVVLYDKQRHVPAAKGVEQRARDLSAARTGKSAADAPLPANTVLALNAPLPQPYQALLNERKVQRPAVLRFLVANLCATLRPPDGARVVFDGHCLSPRQARQLGVHIDGDLGDDFDSLDDDSVPIVLMSTPDATRGTRTVAMYSRQHRNEIGEADFGAFWHASRFARSVAPRRATVVVRTSDSDHAWLSMFYQRTHARRRACAPTAPRTFIDYGAWLFDTEAACAVVERHAPSQPRAVLSLCTAMWAAGGDYVDSFPQVPHGRFLEAWFSGNMELVSVDDTAAAADAIGGGLTLNTAAYVRLVVAAHRGRYGEARLGRDLAPGEHYAAWVARLPTEARALCPSPEHLLWRMMHTEYVLHMGTQVGCEVPRLRLLPLRDYGFKAIDDAEITAENICWAHKVDT